MLSKCANPDCSATFRYLHHGKVYRLDPDVLALRADSSHSDFGVPLSAVTRLAPVPLRKSARSPEYFWLCDHCSETMTLRAERGNVVLVETLRPIAKRAAAS
jgi:hypothetical protein